MYKTMLAALGAASIAFAAPAAAQDFPLKNGHFWNVAEITIDDGHFGDYADHLAGLIASRRISRSRKAGSRIITS